MKNSIRIVVSVLAVLAAAALLAVPFVGSAAPRSESAPSEVPSAPAVKPAAEPAIIVLPAMVIDASETPIRPAKPAPKAKRGKARPASFVHTLAQGGSPKAQTVRVFSTL